MKSQQFKECPVKASRGLEGYAAVFRDFHRFNDDVVIIAPSEMVVEQAWNALTQVPIDKDRIQRVVLSNPCPTPTAEEVAAAIEVLRRHHAQDREELK